MEQNKKIKFKIILPFVLLLIVGLVIVYGLVKERDLPVVGLKLQRVESDTGVKLICEVYNKSDITVHFDNYDIAKGVVQRPVGELGTLEYALITTDRVVQLGPGENYSTEFILEDVYSGHYNASVTTSCKEGTSITMGIQFDVE